MSEHSKIPLNNDSFNALVDAWQASMLALVTTLSPAHRQAVTGNVARLAKLCEARGEVLQETLLIDLHSVLSK